MQAPAAETETNHYLVVILFALIALAVALATVIEEVASGKMDAGVGGILATQLILVIAGVAAYYTAD